MLKFTTFAALTLTADAVRGHKPHPPMMKLVQLMKDDMCPANRKEAKEIFNALDANGDWVIEPNEARS